MNIATVQEALERRFTPIVNKGGKRWCEVYLEPGWLGGYRARVISQDQQVEQECIGRGPTMLDALVDLAVDFGRITAAGGTYDKRQQQTDGPETVHSVEPDRP